MKLVVVQLLLQAVIVAVDCVVQFIFNTTMKLAQVGAVSRYAENLAIVQL